MLRVGVIGAGWWAEQHALALERRPEARIVAACRHDPAALEAFSRRFNARPYTDPARLLDDGEVEAVLVASPHHLHAEHAIAAARAGKHVLLEKPMAPTTRECDAIIRACEDAGVRLLLGHTSHFAHSFLVAKELLRSGEVGEVALASSIMSKTWMEANRREWHLKRESGGGMLLTAGIHALERLMWLVGADVTSVSASVGARFHDQEADDAAMLFLRFANGASASVTSIGYASGAPTHRTELYGTRGHLRVDPVEGVTVGRDERWTTIPGSGREDWLPDALAAEWRDLSAAIADGGQPAVTGAFGRQVIAVIEAAQR
ncbi:MAG TPA: Gfo/Idh/MocA family oxidoreductase, partial [Deinococcales bacterium]|nr:Gfo/Idh/MocA family oxidoreductase [Deinococcales bacterium]